MLDRYDQRAPAITAVAERLTTPQRLTAALENWPRLPGLRRQVPVRLRQRTVYLDVFDPATRTDFELDGALAAKGITVVRFSHDRLTGSPEQVRTEVSTILQAAAA